MIPSSPPWPRNPAILTIVAWVTAETFFGRPDDEHAASAKMLPTDSAMLLRCQWPAAPSVVDVVRYQWPAALSVADADDAGPPAVVAGVSMVTLHLTRFSISLPSGDARYMPTQLRSRLY